MFCVYVCMYVVVHAYMHITEKYQFYCLQKRLFNLLFFLVNNSYLQQRIFFETEEISLKFSLRKNFLDNSLKIHSLFYLKQIIFT